MIGNPDKLYDKLEALIEPTVRGYGFNLWGVEYSPFGGSALLRVFIDGPKGVTLDDCARVSDQISALLDVEDPIPCVYRLEVSSPGLDRVLFHIEQYQHFIGQKLKLRLQWPLHGQRNFRGILEASDADTIRLNVDGNTFCIPMNAIKRARLIS